MRLFLIAFFLSVLYRQTAGTVSVYIYVTTPMNCSEALNYCQIYYTDMLTINSEKDVQMVHKAAEGAYDKSWFKSLSRVSENQCTLMDYKGSKNPTFWAVLCGSPNQPCTSKHPFFCYKEFILVTVNKAWEDALEYCRSHYVDLAFLDYKVTLNLNDAQTNSIWTGLRFLDGKWFWVGMKSIETLMTLPSCPIEPYRCGARNTETDQWENRDCEEKLNFVCV